MRQFIVRTVTGPVDPHMLLARLWPGPQFRRMLTYSVVIHLCLATAVMIARAVNFSFNKLPAVVYSVDMIEMPRPEPVKKATKAVAPKPKPKPPKPKPVAKVEPKPKPKPEAKKPPPPREKKVEIPKVVKPPPKEKPPEVKAKPVKVAKAIAPAPEPEPEPEPVATSTVELDTDKITPELKWYIEMIRRNVWSNWIEPRHALASGVNVRVVIRFEIGRSGAFALPPEIFEPSGNSFFDQSGYRAAFRSAPFPPLPESYTGESLGVQFGFEYGERI